MSNLSKRAMKYYAIQGLKVFAYVLFLQAILAVEWAVIGSSDAENLFLYVFTMFISIGSYFIVLFNMIFSVYGPNWYDSLVLSMGARRKDVFWGEILKQLIFVLGNGLIYMIAIVAVKQYFYIPYMIVILILGIVVGPIGLIIGYKIKKYGKIVLVICALIAGGGGGYMSIRAKTGLNGALVISNNMILAVAAVSIVVFVLAEVWVYKLNQKSMVK